MFCLIVWKKHTLERCNHKANKKIPYLHLRFKADTLNEIITIKLNNVLRRKLSPAHLRISYANHPILSRHFDGELPSSTTAMCVYKFDWSCEATYLGHTIRRLSARLKEHHPAWLIEGRIDNIRSGTVQHLFDSGHRINPDQTFSVHYRVPSNLPRPVKFRTLCMARVVGVRILKPVLCIQKHISHPLSLSWPNIHAARE